MKYLIVVCLSKVLFHLSLAPVKLDTSHVISYLMPVTGRGSCHPHTNSFQSWCLSFKIPSWGMKGFMNPSRYFTGEDEDEMLLCPECAVRWYMRMTYPFKPGCGYLIWLTMSRMSLRIWFYINCKKSISWAYNPAADVECTLVKLSLWGPQHHAYFCSLRMSPYSTRYWI